MISLLIDHGDRYVEGFLNTLIISVFALIGSFVLGTVLAVMRIASIRILRWIGTAYVEFIRNIPLLLVVAIFYHGLAFLGLSGFVAGGIGLTIYTAAYIADAIRAGIQSIPKGQIEAARCSGLSYLQAMRFIVLPQAIKIVIPPLGNQFLNLIKNSAILGVYAGADLMYFGDQINSDTFDTFNVYLLVGLFYLLLTIPTSFAVRALERRMARSS
ncbi:amino acid ABC transporter permease [Paenibacillus sp. SC116]|uniref:amino acid ABC transporter permease n=1 Tax=Paenibacillus sp. SC116 TaxID=2968986 RepID=UPI00215AAD30|nr:amino acid ABC transporter permease [Paenibacillus sp. SC116]MCR8846227.1 amino acid ABC transporter permease [Paenibacillus sp. SC116]